MATAKKNKPWKTGASSKHITNLKQSILETFDISGLLVKTVCNILLVKLEQKNKKMQHLMPGLSCTDRTQCTSIIEEKVALGGSTCPS
jgi:hypothetical protein